jgi:hypothetical protein
LKADGFLAQKRDQKHLLSLLPNLPFGVFKKESIFGEKWQN